MKPRYWIALASGMALAGACAVAVTTSAPTSASPPVILDAVGKHVPAGHYMLMDVYDGSGKPTAHFMIDPATQRAVLRRPFEDVLGEDITIYDTRGHTTFIALGPEVVEGTAGYAYAERLADSLAGMEAKSAGDGKTEGRATTRAVVDLRGDAAGTVSVDIDQETGLRIREDWSRGSDRKTIVRHLVPATSQLTMELDRGLLRRLVQTTLNERMRAMTDLSFDVFALAPGSVDLDLLFITPGPSWDWVGLTYASPGSPGLPALVIESWNLSARPDYPESLLPLLSQAAPEETEAGVRLCYRIGNTGIQLAAYAGRCPGSVADVAARLVDVGVLFQADK